MSTPLSPLSHVGQTAHPEGGLQQQQQQQGQPEAGQGQQPGTGSASDAARHPPQQQADFTRRPADQQRTNERQQHQVDSEDDPASDANTESANHPNDE
jgi:hypothetical protein